MPSTYDVIVLGTGGVGSAALYHLAKRGSRAIGIDRFNPPHDRGSTHGHTRVIRQAYFEHPNYVPLLRESYRAWHELESQIGRRLFHQIGLLEIGPADGIVVPGVLRAAAEHRIPIESLTAAEIESRWPGLRAGNELVGVYEPAAGYLLVEDCVQAHLDLARSAAAALLTDTEVISLTTNKRTAHVRTSDGRDFEAKSVIVAAGAWSGRLLSDLNVRLSVRRKSLFWFASNESAYEVTSGTPVFLFELPQKRSRVSPKLGIGSFGETAPQGVFYGFPKLDNRGVKFAEHTGGRIVDDPLEVDRTIDLEEQQRLIGVLSRHLPGVSRQVTDHAVCLYTMSPDEHFIVDWHPELENVVFAAGLSGHGFKFVPILGRALAEMALDGGTDLPIDFLSLERFSKTPS